MSESIKVQAKLWHLEWYLPDVPTLQPDTASSAIIVSNYELPSNLKCLWDASSYRVCADGGASRLLAADSSLIPSLIIGDFDSIVKDTLKFYERHDTPIIKDSNQDSTDLEKCLNYLLTEEKKLEQHFQTIVVVGGLGGCLSHVFANINALYKYSTRNIVLIGTKNISVICPPHHKTLLSAGTLWKKYKYCSLIPIGTPARISSQGLRWDLDNTTLAFGELVSTSNELAKETAEIITNNEPVLFVLDVVH